MLSLLYRRLGKSGTPETETTTRLTEMLNEAYREVLSHPGLQRLRDDTLTIASVTNQTRYALPWVAKINRMFEATNDRTLLAMSLAQYREVAPDPTTVTGTPSHFVWLGYEPVAKQPSDASSLFAKSTSASDTGTIYLEGETSGGYPRAVSQTLTGTTAVNLAGGISDWVRITKVYLGTAAVGSLTIHEDSGAGTELARIGIGQTQQRYSTFLLYPTPASAITYSVDCTLSITDLAQNNDEPRIPPDFHDLIIAGAMVREYEKTDDTRLTVSQQRYQSRLRDLLYWMHETSTGSSRTGVRGSRTGVRGSTLGPWFPAGT